MTFIFEKFSALEKNLNCDESCFLVCGLLASNIWDFFRSQHSQSKKLKSHKRTLSQKSNNGKGKKGERGLNKSKQKNQKRLTYIQRLRHHWRMFNAKNTFYVFLKLFQNLKQWQNKKNAFLSLLSTTFFKLDRWLIMPPTFWNLFYVSSTFYISPKLFLFILLNLFY